MCGGGGVREGRDCALCSRETVQCKREVVVFSCGIKKCALVVLGVDPGLQPASFFTSNA